MRSRACEAMEHSEDLEPSPDLTRPESSPESSRRTDPEDEKENKRMKKKFKPPSASVCVRRELTKQELVQLLSIMEGEVQAREDIIGLLRSHKSGPEILEAHYGSAAPTRPLQALQRDAIYTNNNNNRQEDVYETPMAELDRLEQKQTETYRRMLEQLLLAEKCHRRTVTELDSEKLKHHEFICKSDDFTDLLEHERDRLKSLLEQEKAYQARKDKEHGRRLQKIQAELVKLRSFVLMLVDERQLHVQQIDRQNQNIHDITQKLQERDQRITVCTETTKEDAQKILRLESELEQKSSKLLNEQEDSTNKLLAQDSQMRQLRLKLVSLSNHIEELQEQNKVLKKSDDELQELRQNMNNGQCSNLVSELESLRKKVLQMEGKDEELIKVETRCKDLKKQLQDSEGQSQELRLEVGKVQKRLVQLEQLESFFNKSEDECSQLHKHLETENRLVKDLSVELEAVKAKVKALESTEAAFEKDERSLKDELMKLKSFTAIMVDERQNLRERLNQEEQKCGEICKKLKLEEAKVTEVTEKLIEERKELLKLKSDTEASVTDLEEKLASEEEKRKELTANVNSANARINELLGKLAASDKRFEDKNKTEQELALEVDKLRSRLKHLEITEGDLLDERFRTEREKDLDELKEQIAKNKTEAELKIRLKMEQASREHRAETQVLQEKIQDLMNTEDQLSQLHVAYGHLQQKYLDEEAKRIHVTEDLVILSQELEATKRYSRALRPSINGNRVVPVTSTATQTDCVDDETSTAGFIKKSVQEENQLMSNLRQKGKKPVLDRYPPAWGADPASETSWSHSGRPPGRPLLIRVTPDPRLSRATLEITGPRAVSGTTITPKITIVPKPTTVASYDGHERAQSPVTITTISKARNTEGSQTPVSVVTVSTTPVNDVTDHLPGRTVIRMGPDSKSNSNIITTEDNKIHIHLGSHSHYKRHTTEGLKPEEMGLRQSAGDGAGVVIGVRQSGGEGAGVVIGPRQSGGDGAGVVKMKQSKMTSSIMITPTPGNPRTQTTPSSDTWSHRSPVSKSVQPGTKCFLGLSTVTRLESRAESMKIQLRKGASSSSSSSSSSSGEKRNKNIPDI